jgi:hypothetical protein
MGCPLVLLLVLVLVLLLVLALVLDLLGFSGVKRIRFPSVTICSTALTARGRISHRPVFTVGISSTSTRKNPFRNGETDWTIKIL